MTPSAQLKWIRRSLVRARRYPLTAEDYKRLIRQLVWATAKFRRET